MAMTLTLVGMLALFLAQHPFLTYPLSLHFIRRWGGAKPLSPDAPSQPARGEQPSPGRPKTVAHPLGGLPRSGGGTCEGISFAVCVCAYNEEQVIEAKVNNLLMLREQEPGLEILFYVDAATDRTAQILERYRDRIFLHVADERHGKTHGMNLLVAQAKASILVFSDANVMLDRDVLKHLRAHFADPQVGCVSGNLIYTNGDASVTAATGSLYWRLEQRIKEMEQDIGSVMGADGSIFAIRRALHHPPPPNIIDDMYVSFMALCDGFRVIQAKDVRAYEESVTSAREEFRRKVRIACQAFNAHRLIWPRLKWQDGLTVYAYVSHKFLRWLTIYFLALAALCFGAALAAAGYGELTLGLAALCLAALVVGHRWRVKPLAQVADILLALTGAGLGVWRSLRGEQFQTWAPAASIRR